MYEIEKKIMLPEPGDIVAFVKAAEKCNFEIDVFYNRAVIDAKSLVGMIAIGLAKDIVVRYGGRNANFENVVAKYAIA